MKEQVRMLKIHLKCICSDLALSPRFRSLQFIIYSLLPQTPLVSPVRSHYHILHTHLSLDTYTMWHNMELQVRNSSSEVQHCIHSLIRDNRSVSRLTFSCSQNCFSYRMIVEEVNLFFGRVCPLWPFALPSVMLTWLHLTLAGLPHAWVWKKTEPAESLNLQYNMSIISKGRFNDHVHPALQRKSKVTLG